MARISISNSEKRGMAINLTREAADHLGGLSTYTVIEIKPVDGKVDMFLISIRANPHGKNKITNQALSKRQPFRITFQGLEGWYKRLPYTPPKAPAEFTYNSDTPGTIQFYVTRAELQGYHDLQEKPTLSKLTQGEQFRIGMGSAPAVALPGDKTLKSFADLKEAINPTQPERLVEQMRKEHFATPFQPDFPDEIDTTPRPDPKPVVSTIPPVKAVAVFQSASYHEALNQALKNLNASLMPEVNDVELFIEEIDALGNTKNTINLPPPGNIRIRGRIIREEILG